MLERTHSFWKVASCRSWTAVVMNLLLFLTVLERPAMAFKPKTHVWVAQQVLNDIADGCQSRSSTGSCVTIEICVDQLPGGDVVSWSSQAPCRMHEFEVSPAISNALLRHPAAYRLGHVGPDAFPDLVVGQVTVHPGRKNGWQADDWLRWLLEAQADGDQERAFAYGYVGHAAGDIFAHTYVNTYTGDRWDFEDGEGTVEKRHFALEDFISRHTPPITDEQGHEISTADLFAVPARFLTRRLVFDAEPSREYQQPATVHLVAMNGVRRAVDDLDQQLSRYTIESELLDRIEAELRKGAAIAREIDRRLGPLETARESAETLREVWTKHTELVAEIDRKIAEAEREILSLEQQRIEAVRRAETEIPNALSHLEGEINRVVDEIAHTAINTLCDSWNDVCVLWSPIPPFNCIESVRNPIQVQCPNEVYNQLTRQRDELRRQRDRLNQELADRKAFLTSFAQKKLYQEGIRNEAVERKKDELRRIASEGVEKSLREAEVLFAKLKEEKESLDRRAADVASRAALLGVPLQELRTLRAMLQSWREDLFRATDGYMDAGRKMAALMTEDQISLSLYGEWLVCWGPAFLGIPSEVPQSGCAALHTVDQLLGQVDKTRKAARDAFGETGGWVVDPLGKFEEEIGKKLKPALAKAAVDIAPRIGGTEWQAFVAILVEDYDDSRLNQLWTSDQSGKNLLLIDDMADRVKRDMAVAGGKFSPTNFWAARNASVLAKLTLLSASELNRLAALAGWWPPSHWGPSLYKDRPGFNILVGAVRSLDGNHQWSEVSPPLARRSGKDSRSASDRRYGYGLPEGFRLFSSEKARKLVFQGIFKGPLNPNIDDLLPRDYPYRPTVRNPYPVMMPGSF